MKYSDLRKIKINSQEFGLCNYSKILEAMILWPDQDFNSVRYHQCNSKIRLVEKLSIYMSWKTKILICGSWHGVLGMMLEGQGFSNFLCIDTDLGACDVARHLGIHTYPYDMFKTPMDNFDVIINTCCEHIEINKWLNLIPEGKMVALQNTNMPWKDHINAVNSIDQFKIQARKMSIVDTDKIEFTGPAPEMKIYKRFTLIGTT